VDLGRGLRLKISSSKLAIGFNGKLAASVIADLMFGRRHGEYRRSATMSCVGVVFEGVLFKGEDEVANQEICVGK
jgi:hypothetical protein